MSDTTMHHWWYKTNDASMVNASSLHPPPPPPPTVTSIKRQRELQLLPHMPGGLAIIAWTRLESGIGLLPYADCCCM